MKKIAILASGSGTNAENIARTFNEGNRIRVDIVLTNREHAGVIERMNRLNVDTEYIPNRVWDEAPMRIVEMLQWRGIDLIVLAGFMHYVSPVILNAFPGRVINIHPSLLPRHGGKGMWGHHVHEAVLAAGDTESGVTVHYVTEEFDSGEILMQQKVPVFAEDTAATLEARIHKTEYELYPRAVVAALNRLDSAAPLPPALPVGETVAAVEAKPVTDDSDLSAGQTEVVENVEVKSSETAHGKSVEEEWADVLKVKYDPSSAAVPPPVPGAADVPPVPGSPNGPAQPYQRAFTGRNVTPAPAREPMPPTYLLWSILCTICCCFIPGIAAIVFSSMVSSRYAAGDVDGARRASRMAQIWIIVSFVLGVLTASLYIPLSMVG